MTHRFLVTTVIVTLFGSAAQAADWPQWRGPNRDGKSAETGLLKSWPADGPKLVWKLPDVGIGYGSVAVVGDKIYLAGANAGKKDVVHCLNANTGQTVWSKEIPTSPGQYAEGWGSGPRMTPTIDGDNLYVLGPTGDLVCLKTANGDMVWSKNLVKDLGGDIPQWGYSESVLIDGDKLLVTPGGKKGGRGEKVAATQKPDFKGAIVALNKKDGSPIWTAAEVKDPAGYSSILATDVGGVRIYIQQTMGSSLAVRASDGKLMWRFDDLNRMIAVIPTPVLDGDFVFFTCGYNAGCEAVQMKADGKGGVEGKLVYTKNSTVASHTGGVIAEGGYVYGHSDAGGWTCFDYKKGPKEAAWQNNKIRGKGSISYADGHFYCYAEDTGTLYMIKVNPKEWEEVGKLTIPEKSTKRPRSGKVWPHPVIANGKLYLRDYDLLFCFDLKGAASE